MREFSSFLDAAIYVGTALAAEVENQHHGLDQAAKVVQAEAKDIIGHYQEGAGPFAPWAQLAPATMEDRARQGFPEDEPLLRTGELRESIQRKVLDGSTAAVGSDSDVMVYQELGTRTIPPRSSLGIAAVHKAEQVANILGAGVVRSLVGEKVHEGSIDL